MTAIAMRLTGWMWLDPATSILINLIIVIGTWSLLRESFNLATDEHSLPQDGKLVHRPIPTRASSSLSQANHPRRHRRPANLDHR